MKAASYSRNGPAADVLEIVERAKPQPRPGEVLVRVAFSGVNPSDVKSRAGRPLTGSYQIPHSDASGTIEAVGEGVAPTRVGEAVWTWNGAWKRPDGTCAQYVALPQEQAVPLPQDVSLETGACLGIPGMTAAHALNLLAKESDAHTVLVTGAGSSVGNLAAQMTVAAGYRVIGTASSRRFEMAKAAGCDAVIDPHAGDTASAIIAANSGNAVDAIIDLDFSSTASLLPSGILKPHGVLIGYGSNDMGAASFDFRTALFNAHRFSFFVVYELTDDERRKAEERLYSALVATKALTIAIDKTYSLNEVAASHQRVESGNAMGNVLVALP
ncbi:MAG: NADPH:quinone reductase [Nitratireductor sp.]|nr:NADPH:quinone reductase [Nitratireductor sp.]